MVMLTGEEESKSTPLARVLQQQQQVTAAFAVAGVQTGVVAVEIRRNLAADR